MDYAKIPNYLNPDFIFSSTTTELLVNAVCNKIDLLKLAHKELAARGLDCGGKWVGFEKAASIHSQYLGN